MSKMQHRFLELVVGVLSADRSVIIASIGLIFDLACGLLYNFYPDKDWACDAYFLGDAIAATCYTWALLLFYKCVIFEFALALYASKMLDEVFGDPTEPNLWSFLIIVLIFIEIRYKIINRLINGVKHN